MFNIIFGKNRSSADVSYAEYYQHIINTYAELQTSEPEFRKVEVTFGHIPTGKTTLFNTHKVLSDFQNGVPIQTLELRYGIAENRILSWVNAARAIAAIKTREGMSRMVASTLPTISGENLLPALVVDYAEVRFLNDLVVRLRNKLEKDSEALSILKEAIRYYLTHSIVSNTGIPFLTAKELPAFVDAFFPALSLEQWRVSIGDAESQVLTVALLRQMLQETNFHKVTLFLRHPKEKTLVDNGQFTKYSSAILRFFIHMTAIRTLGHAELSVKGN